MESNNVLVISRSAWRDDNSTGNTLSNFFCHYPKTNIANLYVREEGPDNKVCEKYFKISEKDLLRGTRGFYFESKSDVRFNKIDINKNRYLRFFRSTILLWVRELLWGLFDWRTKELDQFVSNFSPSVIFMPVYNAIYMHRLCKYVKSNSSIRLVLFHCDDYLSYRCFSLSPMFWVNRFFIRRSIIQLSNIADINYCISQKQIDLYSSILNNSVEFDLLYKSVILQNVSKPPIVNFKNKKVFKIIYTGNLESGRIKTINILIGAISKLNNTDRSKTITLDVYSNSKEKFPKNRIDNINFYPAISYLNIKTKLKESDILLHVESFSLKERLATSLSFSTKIVDYLEAGKCILAIGWEESASISYLKSKECAHVITNCHQVESKLAGLIESEKLYNNYAQNGYTTLLSNHDGSAIHTEFYNKLIGVK